MVENKIYYRRNLPHFQPPGYTFFITFRLADSLPQAAIIRLMSAYKTEIKALSVIKNEKEKRNKYKKLKWDYFEKFDSSLGRYSQNNWLKREDIAKVVFDAIVYRYKKVYDIIAFTIMPNHVHMVFALVERTDCSLCNIEENSISKQVGSPLYKIMQSLKWFTALECNKLLNRSGQFWQHESYDHVVRNYDELNNIIEYVINNPVKSEFDRYFN